MDTIDVVPDMIVLEGIVRTGPDKKAIPPVIVGDIVNKCGIAYMVELKSIVRVVVQFISRSNTI